MPASKAGSGLNFRRPRTALTTRALPAMEGLAHGLQVLLGHLGVHRQRQHLVGRLLGCAGRSPSTRRRRRRPAAGGPGSGSGSRSGFPGRRAPSSGPRARACARRRRGRRGGCPGHLGGKPEAGVGEEGAVARGVRPARLRPPLEVAQLHAQDGALHPLHAVVVAGQDVVVLPLLRPSRGACGSCGRTPRCSVTTSPPSP